MFSVYTRAGMLASVGVELDAIASVVIGGTLLGGSVRDGAGNAVRELAIQGADSDLH